MSVEDDTGPRRQILTSRALAAEYKQLNRRRRTSLADLDRMVAIEAELVAALGRETARSLLVTRPRRRASSRVRRVYRLIED